MIILKAEKIIAGYTEVDILHDVQIGVNSGEIVSVIGPNGAGKSTLLKTIFGILKPRKGKVTLKEEDITGLKPERIARRGISYVPQVNNVFPTLTIMENLEMGAFIRNDDYGQRLEEMFDLFPLLLKPADHNADFWVVFCQLFHKPAPVDGVCLTVGLESLDDFCLRFFRRLSLLLQIPKLALDLRDVGSNFREQDFFLRGRGTDSTHGRETVPEGASRSRILQRPKH